MSLILPLVLVVPALAQMDAAATDHGAALFDTRTPKGRSPADFECDARFLQISTSQQFLRLTFGIAARLVQFG